MKFGCHGSTWELNYDIESDRLPSIFNTIREADFKGIDAQYSLLGRFKDNPLALKKELENKDLKLAALTFPFSWETNEIKEKETEKIQYFINYLKHFPGSKLNIAPRVHENRDDLLKHQESILEFANSIAKKSHNEGVLSSFHPSSPPGSMFRIESDYNLMLQELDFNYISYTPDAGHIAFGGMDVKKIFEKFLPYIKHVHFKDATMSNEWRKMGTGEIDFIGIVKMLKEANYDGWIMFEEETDESSADPHSAVLDIGSYVKRNLLPITKGGRE